MKRVVAGTLLWMGCDDALDQRLAIVDAPRVLAVISEPAEVKPGGEVTYQAVVAGPDGPIADEPAWAYCVASKPPTEDNAVAAACLDAASLVSLGSGSMVVGNVPDDACLRFGPDTPGEGFRPRDPDGTGGYYQPVRLDVVDEIAFGFSRVTCKLPTASSEDARRYDLEYVANENPMLDAITLATAPPDSDVTLVASWPATAAETYLYYDLEARRLVERSEALRLFWFSTGGRLAVDSSIVGEGDPSTSVSTTWHTPGPGPVHLWFVLRDSRGGVRVQTATVDVR